MQKIILAIALSIFSLASFAQTYVNSYTRSDGTQVQGHYRSDSNGTVRDNYSYKGNSNPYTGSKGTNRYESSPSSEYYNGGSSTKSNSTYKSNNSIYK
jgi:hypothetical protein